MAVARGRSTESLGVTKAMSHITSPNSKSSDEPPEPKKWRPSLRYRLIAGLIMACVFGGAKWSDVPTADGVFWVMVALGFAIGWGNNWL
jgi:hypothetical protein